MRKEFTMSNKCGRKTEVFSRVCGYHSPIRNWNKGKQSEFKERKPYDVKSLMKEYTSGRMVNLRTSQKGEIKP